MFFINTLSFCFNNKIFQGELLDLTNKTLLVTGGAGFIGSHLARKLLDTRNPGKVILYDNFCASTQSKIADVLQNEKADLAACDLRDFDVLENYVEQSEVIFHLAASKLVVAMERPRIDLETNIIGMFNILQLAKKYGTRVIYVSTGSVLGSSPKPMNELHPCNPTTLYGISKYTAEQYCRFYHRVFGVNVSILRYFHVYGPLQDYSGDAGVVSIFISRILRGAPPVIYGSGEQIRCFTYVEDDVDATILLAERDDTIGETYNVASPSRISVKELAEIVIEKYGHDGLGYEFGPAREGENLKPIPDTSKIESLGWKAQIPFEEGLERTKDWIIAYEK